MNHATASLLNRINQLFYCRQSDSFSATRDHAWPGWLQLLPLIPPAQPLNVLDAGCGNGRFFSFLQEHAAGRPIEAVGLDTSAAMLREAALRGGTRKAAEWVQAEWVQWDLFEQPLEQWMPGRTFDLVTAFGLFHHMPGAFRRADLLKSLYQRLRPGGLLAITLWRFIEQPRFQSRIIAWSDVIAATELPIDTTELERNDVILGWEDHPDAFRFCHGFDDLETSRLIADSDCIPRRRFRADGRSGDLNEYLVFIKPPLRL